MSDNWIVQNLENALNTWNEKLSEIWSLITQSPETFKGGSIWNVVVNIHGALQAIGYALLVLFFVIGVVKTCGSFAEVKKPEHALKLFVRFAIAKGLITYDNFIFVNRDGHVQHQGTLNKAIKRITRDCNDEILEKCSEGSDPVLLPNFSCHNLRHTFATRLCESGINLKVIQDVLGHADVSTTMNIYVDVTNDLKKKEIASFGAFINSDRQTNA